MLDTPHFPTRAIRRWLWCCCGMIFAMAVIGAITRLTESGLSIVTWEPVKDMLPPLTEAAWQQAFRDYQQLPQYRLLNQGMELAAFQQIYFWEWLHRLWGRLLGLVYALPFFYFLLRYQLPRRWQIALWGGLLLGGLQGMVGKFMVASGLSELVYVSHYRLAMHLVLALLIYSYLFWLALGLTSPRPPLPRPPSPALRWHGWLCFTAIGSTICWGAFVAGLKAGWVYNSFPFMDGVLLPEAAWTLRPLWHNFFANTALVQFCHRWLAIGTALLIWLWCERLRRVGAPQWHWLAIMVLIQIIVGITTLIYAVPIALGTLHQAGAIMLLSLIVLNLKRITL